MGDKSYRVLQNKNKKGVSSCSFGDNQNPFFKPSVQRKNALNKPCENEYQPALNESISGYPNHELSSFFNFHSFSHHNFIQRKCAECEKEEEEKLQRKEGNEGEINNADTSLVDEALSSPAGSMDQKTQAFMESRMSYDFSNVKIHTGSLAARSARSVNALAYTSGNNVVFNEGQYIPETNAGKRLIAHELTHVMQQNQGAGGHSIQKQDSDGGNGHSSSATTTSQINTTVNIASSCNQSDIVDVVNQSLTWLDDIYSQLLEYDADEVFRDAIPPGSNYTRIAGALQQAFNTTDLTYVEVIRRRFLHLANMLRTNGKISIDCNGQFCTSGGSSFTAAYVTGPYALTMCGVGTSSHRPIATFIHELVHAVIPQIGISNDVTTGDRVTDRAYRGDRVFQHLSPEETLDNADSYGILAELLHSRTNTQLVTPQADTTQGCAQSNVVLEAFARADQWHHFGLHELDLDVNLLQGNPLTTLSSGNLSMLNRAFPSITDTAQLTALRDAFQTIERSGFGGSNWDFTCVNSSDRNCGNNVVVFSNGGKVSVSSVTLQNMRIGEAARICPDWFNLSHDDRIRTLYAAFLLGRPSWIVAGLQLQNALDYVDGARRFTTETVPAPTTTSAREHIESDDRFRRSQRSSP